MKITRCRFNITSLACMSSVIAKLKGQSCWSTEVVEWKQRGGSSRDFAVSKVPSGFDKPPKLIWNFKIGKGHSAVVADRKYCYVVYLIGDSEIVEKRELDSGRRVWKNEFPVEYHSSIADYDGPHSTPLLDGNTIYCVSIDARVYAFDVVDGRKKWSFDLRYEIGTQLPQSGYASSPLIGEGKLVLPTLGNPQKGETEYFRVEKQSGQGTPGAVALRLVDGLPVWQADTFRSSHASPICVNIRGQEVVIFHGMFELVGVDLRTGQILWRHLLRDVAADNVSFMPIWDPVRRQVIISHGYCDTGTQAIRISGNRSWETETAWTNHQLRIVHTNAVLLNSTLIGTNRPSPTLAVAIDVTDGRTVSRKRGYKKCNFVAIDSRLLIQEESGDLIAADWKENEINELSRSKECLSSPAWTEPTIVGNKVLIRDQYQVKAYAFPDP